MAEIVIMPKLGFDMAEGTLVRWVINEGEPVEKGAVLAEIETDKATVEVESPYSGQLHKHLVSAGDVVPVSTPIAVVAAAGEQVDTKALLGEVAPTAETGLRPGAPEEEQEALPRDSAVDDAQKSAQTAGETISSAAAAPEAAAAPASTPEADGRLPEGMRISPLARKMAAERGVDLRKLKGSGPGGRIVKADIENFKETAPAAAAPAAPSAAPERQAALPLGAPRPDRTIQGSRLRGAIGRRMTESKQQVPHFYVTSQYDMAALMDMRKQVNAMLPDEEKISVNDFIVKAAALTLAEFPNLNASLVAGKNEVLQHGQVNVGVAVAVEGGLLTVVCKDSDRKPLRQIAAEIKGMVKRARDGKVRPDDIEGSTFSVSNLGMYNVDHFIAIINPPEAAILAVGSVQEVPVVVNGEIKAGLRMKATLSVDHRVSDGAEGAQFMLALGRYLEQPLRLLV